MRVVVHIEQLRRQTVVVNVFVALAARHHHACLARAQLERARRAVDRVIELRDRGLAHGLCGTIQQGPQGFAFEPVIRHRQAHGLDEGGQEINRFDQRVRGGTVGLRRRRVGDDHRDAHALLVHEFLFAEPVVAEVIAVIGGEHDHRVVLPPLLPEKGQQLADVVIDLLDQAHVGGNHIEAVSVARKRHALGMRAKALVHRVIVVTLCAGADRRLDILTPVHVVIRRLDDVGPVRLDVGEVQQPGRIALLLDEVHRAPRHVGSLAVLVGRARRAVRVAKVPAAGDIAGFVGAGIGPRMPGVVTCHAEIAQVFVVGELGVNLAVRVNAVVTLVRLKPGLGKITPALAFARDRQARHAIGVGSHVRLADHRAAHARRPQIVTQGLFTGGQGNEVPGRAVRKHIAPGVKRGARRPAVG